MIVEQKSTCGEWDDIKCASRAGFLNPLRVCYVTKSSLQFRNLIGLLQLSISL